MGALAEPSHLATLNLGSPKLRLPTDVPRGGAALSLPPRNTKKPDSAAASDYDDDDERPHLHHEVPGGSPYLRHLGAVALDPPIHDPRDAGTADAWVERSPTLLRLTGKHPFNGEPPTSELMRHGFITPAPLHYVRNHGAVPKADWASWTVEVTGLVRRPARFTMDELVRDFKPLELPITLACSSGRRKEQNMTRQTLGFHWGPGAVSTSLWRGARLRDVLGRCGVERGAKYVCFEGGDDLPGGGGCRYGTSITCVRAMDPTMDVMLAYMQNGGPVLPDHGFPVRLIVPGYTAGRMVKWLRRIVVTTAESDNYYHHRDNRLFPSHVDAKLAEAEGWWYKPEYVINEMSTNSVITTPANGEVLPINATTAQSSYTVKGFAFSGGGKKVIRVELTLDGGETWLLCSLNHPERPTKYGKHWCWCFWSVDVEVADLLATKEIAVRAWDQTLNTQPENLTWNLMGMMTNCWFRVKINVCRPRKGEIGVSFEHPVQPGPGNQSGGWMARHKNLETTPEPPAAAPTNRWTSSSAASSKSTMKRFTMAEVREHASRDSAWIVVHGRVYDCTNYLKDHPGGADSILLNAGTDCTDEFDAIHSDKAVALLNGYLIGDLVTTGSGTDSPDNNNNKTIVVMKPVPDALSNPREKVPIRLVSKKELSRDVRLLRFALPSSDQLLGLPVGKHLFVCAMIEGKLCMRAYTPTSSPDERGHVDLLVKVYFKNEHPKFPDGGRMTQYLDSLQIGSYVDVKGPLGHVEYLGRGGFMLNGGEKRTARRLAMVAGGSGITPIYQVIQAVLRDQPEDTTVMHLVYANRTEDDILLRDELDRWAAEFPERLKVWYVISQVRRPEKRWRYSVGTVKEDVLREHLPEGGDDTLALACGPPLMIQQAVSPNLEKMKYKSDSVIVF